jgi:nimC/nimA family protein
MAKVSFFRNCFLLVTIAQNSAYFTKSPYGDIIIASTGKHNIFPKKFLGGFIMNKVIEFLKENPVQYLATVGRNGKAKCRPFMFAGEMDGKLWFCTNNTKDVYLDMQSNPEIEISVSSPSYAWIRLHGKAAFENNMAAKEMCIANPIVKGQYETADNPIFEVFYLDEPHGVIADFSGNPPYTF